jgi:PAS domain S-box-containing protein
MFERLIEQARACYGHAADAKQKAEAAADPESKASLLDMEKRWLALARSYQLIESLEGPSTATSALREAQERFRWLASIVASSDDAIVGKNLDGIVTSWNKGAERLFGYTEEEAVGKPVMILIPPDQHNEEDMILERIRRGEHIEHYETVRRRKDGSSIVVSLTVSPVKNVEGRIVGASKIARDITERKRAEARERALMAELTSMNRAATAGELSASLAHELKQPLTGIVTRASAARHWLAAENLNIDKARAALDQIEIAGHRAADIIQNVSAVFKKDTRERKPIDVNRIIVEVLSLGEIEFKKHQIEVHTKLDNRLPSVTGNRVQLQQVILNVVMNAIEAMQSAQPRRLRIQSGLSKPDVVNVSIADTGIGIDPANADAIFKPLFTTKEHGMGMGLSICHSIIENHGGRIWASPGAPNGTIVQFELPTNWQRSGGHDATQSEHNEPLSRA